MTMTLMMQRSRYTVRELVAARVLEPPIDGNHGELHPKESDFVPAGILFVVPRTYLMAGSIWNPASSYQRSVHAPFGRALRGPEMSY